MAYEYKNLKKDEQMKAKRSEGKAVMTPQSTEINGSNPVAGQSITQYLDAQRAVPQTNVVRPPTAQPGDPNPVVPTRPLEPIGAPKDPTTLPPPEIGNNPVVPNERDKYLEYQRNFKKPLRPGDEGYADFIAEGNKGRWDTNKETGKYYYSDAPKDYTGEDYTEYQIQDWGPNSDSRGVTTYKAPVPNKPLPKPQPNPWEPQPRTTTVKGAFDRAVAYNPDIFQMKQEALNNLSIQKILRGM